MHMLVWFEHMAKPVSEELSAKAGTNKGPEGNLLLAPGLASYSWFLVNSKCTHTKDSILTDFSRRLFEFSIAIFCRAERQKKWQNVLQDAEEPLHVRVHSYLCPAHAPFHLIEAVFAFHT
jgi:hypothetical protein